MEFQPDPDHNQRHHDQQRMAGLTLAEAILGRPRVQLLELGDVPRNELWMAVAVVAMDHVEWALNQWQEGLAFVDVDYDGFVSEQFLHGMWVAMNERKSDSMAVVELAMEAWDLGSVY